MDTMASHILVEFAAETNGKKYPTGSGALDELSPPGLT